ncbi:hypothetical protein GW17_00023571 [Ensete ventricosum]|nr:hypothetical protein GW17_00023571 [Ensete ventricosum]
MEEGKRASLPLGLLRREKESGPLGRKRRIWITASSGAIKVDRPCPSSFRIRGGGSVATTTGGGTAAGFGIISGGSNRPVCARPLASQSLRHRVELVRMSGDSGVDSGVLMLEWRSPGEEEVVLLGSAAGSCKEVGSGRFPT